MAMPADDRLLDEEHLVMLREIALQPQFVRGTIDAVVERARDALRAHHGRPLERGFAVGCGDSFFAGLAARQYLSASTRRWVDPVDALEFCGYLVDHLPPGTFALGISNSGSVARTVEAMRLARAADAWTFAVTVDPHSALAQTAETVIRVDTVPNIKQRADGSKLVTPGTLTYTASLVALCAAGVALAEHVGAFDAAAGRTAQRDLARVADWMDEADAEVATAARELAATFSPERTTVFMGSGPNAATALYAAAKWYEALQWPAHHAGIEEWAHQQYFFTGGLTDTVAILPPGPARQRGLEQLRAAREMGSRAIAIGERGDTELAAAADVFLPMPSGIPEALTPFVYKLPVEYLAAHIAQRYRIDFFGFANPMRQRVNFRQIFDSAPARDAAR